jgi:hypothetical protein
MSLNTYKGFSDAKINDILNPMTKLDDLHNVRKYQEWRQRLEEEARRLGFWAHFDPNDKKALEREDLKRRIAGTDEMKLLKLQLERLENEDKAVAFLKGTITRELQLHLHKVETAADMLKALTPTTHALDSIATLTSILLMTAIEFGSAVEMLEELKRLHTDLQQAVTADDTRFYMSEELLVMTAISKLNNQYAQLKTDAALNVARTPKTMLELLETVRVITMAKLEEDGQSSSIVAHHAQSPQGRTKCAKCKYTNHETKDCRAIICWTCNTAGHKTAECRRKQYSGTSTSSRESDRDAMEFEEFKRWRRTKEE